MENEQYTRWATYWDQRLAAAETKGHWWSAPLFRGFRNGAQTMETTGKRKRWPFVAVWLGLALMAVAFLLFLRVRRERLYRSEVAAEIVMGVSRGLDAATNRRIEAHIQPGKALLPSERLERLEAAAHVLERNPPAIPSAKYFELLSSIYVAEDFLHG